VLCKFASVSRLILVSYESCCNQFAGQVQGSRNYARNLTTDRERASLQKVCAPFKDRINCVLTFVCIIESGMLNFPRKSGFQGCHSSSIVRSRNFDFSYLLFRDHEPIYFVLHILMSAIQDCLNRRSCSLGSIKQRVCHHHSMFRCEFVPYFWYCNVRRRLKP
jgi:hypothetical protein